MTTYTTLGFSTEFDLNDDAISFTDATFTIIAPDLAPGFTYTYDIPGDPSGLGVVTVNSGAYSATVNIGGAEIPLSSAFETEILFIDWGAGNTTLIMAFIIDIGGVDTDFVMVLGGDPLPTINTLAEFNAFEATITGEGQITTGPFAPGALIDYDSSGDTTVNEDDQITDTVDDDTLDGGVGDDSIDGGDGNDLLIGGAGTTYTIPGFGLIFDQITDIAISFTLDLDFTINAPNGVAGFSYTYDNGVDTDVTITGNFAAFALGGLALDTAQSTEIFEINWGAGGVNTTTLILAVWKPNL